MNRRILTICLALVLAAVGTGAVYVYVQHANQRALAGQQATDVLVATKRIPAGTSASTAMSKGYVRTDHLPQSATPAGAVSSVGSDWSSDVATADIQSGQVLLRPMFASQRTPTTSGLVIPANKMAVAVKLGVDGDVAGYVQPGSQIAIFDTFVLLDPKTGFVSGSKNASDKTDDWATKLLLPRVDVLAVSQAAPSGTKTGLNGAGIGGGSQTELLITVAVSQTDAERLVHVAQTGMPYAALLSSDSQSSTNDHGVDNQARLGGIFATEDSAS